MKITGKRIGRGYFSAAYGLENGKVLLKTICPTKALISKFCARDIPHRFIPLEYIGTADATDIFMMERYVVPRSRKELKEMVSKDEYELYSQLATFMHVIYKISRVGNGLDHVKYQDSFVMLLSAILPKKYRKEVKSISEVFWHIVQVEPTVVFEIKPQNVAVVKGKIKFLDCFYTKRKQEHIFYRHIVRPEYKSTVTIEI